MSYAYQVESITEALDELKVLTVDHYKEIAHHQDKVALNPNWDRYVSLERQMNFALITCRKDGALVGYVAWFIQPHMHYVTTTYALNDVIYLKPEHRRGRVGVRLMDESEYLLKVLGVDRVTWHIKPEHDWSAILKRRGYQLEEYVYGKYIGA